MTRLKEWLELSTDGFAQRQADRPPAHLLKELIQNALDATEDTPGGKIEILLEGAKHGRRHCVRVLVTDNGPGVADPADLRTVFSTSKTDTFLLRGRLGQGLKEVLCICYEARVCSNEIAMRFHIDKGDRVTDVEKVKPTVGTVVEMWLPWRPAVIPDLVQYLQGLIVPDSRTIWVNGQLVPQRTAEHRIDVSLSTELFQEGKWLRRVRPGMVELVPPAFPGETPRIFEMGIPIQDVDWTQPYHVNVLMRVPMNPRRDAVAAGYLKDLYRQVLPTLMPKLEPEQLRDEWVSLAIEQAEPELRQEIISTAFGPDAVRAVPSMGRHDWDSDAREMGLQPINTSLLPKGLRDAATELLPSSREAELQRRETVNVAFTLSSNTRRDHDEPLMAFIAWLAGQLVGIPVDVRITEELVIRGATCTAAWAAGGRLTLNNRCRSEWQDPMSERFLGLLVHEVAHENAGHHGDDFRREVERMAGKLARLCLDRAEEVRNRYGVMRVAIEDRT